MSKGRTIPLSYLKPTYDVCLVGHETKLDIYRSVPPGATSFEVRGSSLLNVTVVYNPKRIERRPKENVWPLNKEARVVVSPVLPSKELHDRKVKVSYYGSKGTDPLGSAMLYLTNIDVALNVDVNRTGVVSRGAKDKDTWTWGQNGKGAILLVNCDQDKDTSSADNEAGGIPNLADLKDMSLMTLTADGPDELFDDMKLILNVSAGDADKLKVYQNIGRSKYSHVLGEGKLSYTVSRGNLDEIIFNVEGLKFPDVDFSGLVYINLTVQNYLEKMEIFSESVVFRMAPWIMTPSTLKPLEVYVCSVPDNKEFVKELTALVEKARCKLTICPEIYNAKDRWIQDEMEFGYTEAPHKRLPVVFDSPRNRGLAGFPHRSVLGPDFGYVTREPENEKEVNTLDAFGNLEVSPPVTVNGKSYPFGRILYGSGLPKENVRMNKVIRDFLEAQQLQAPVELYSYWLTVGHVDEFMSFVPAPDQKGFRLLLASPKACLELFREKQKAEYGDAAMFKGVRDKKITIDDVLADDSLMQYAKTTQEYVDLNRDIMKKELGLSEEDIIDIPLLYNKTKFGADSFFPNVVNMLVLDKLLVIPKPFGPIINGECCLEKIVRSLLEPLGLKCNFIDDYWTYHRNFGEVHCGTNVVRKPFSKKWWEIAP
ncbi:protein-arginine deiminase type-1-like [Bombina bombina]|uniref:protein-arginine deiminase type-1-like n=1 Tax=Bombina bombina TaxID=8345 RepID=UPI00235A72C8|nr:protein-arginine deiminase type-1-like [Bombina bombina]